MAPMPSSENLAKPFGIGTVLSRTLALLRDHFLLFFALALLALLPNIIGKFALTGLRGMSIIGMNISYAAIGFLISTMIILSFFLSCFLQGAAAYGVFQILTGNRISLWACLAKAWTRVGALLPLAFLIATFLAASMFIVVSFLRISMTL